MKYYFRLSGGFLRQIVFPILFLVLCMVNLLGPRHGHPDSFFFYVYLSGAIIWLLLTVATFSKTYTVIKLALKKQPLLEANEVWLHDCVSGRKFYWDDIEEVINDKSVLEIKIYDPEPYLSAPKGLFRRWFFKKESKKVFKIDLSYLKANFENLTNTLNDFSIKAMELKAENK
ncbi:hypothetical protein AAFN85_23580 [Mucilaginibacter sp. CAU 1740]|uniref:hypothetical protein n=1 Tax=Mucilaginibacter sp. CAU 1740 TaxID=3140365 RepID=UPI00325A79B2